VVFCSISAAQTQDARTASADSSRSGIFPLPILFYTPETGLAGGAAALFMYRDGISQRASSITADVIYTEKKQIIVEVSGDQYFNKGVYRLQSDIAFQKYPNKFFGIGNFTAESGEEDYTAQSFLFHAAISRNASSRFNIGPMIWYEHVSMKEIEPGKSLASGVISGSTGGTLCGAGFVANWDSRDNTFASTEGSFYQLTGLFYRRALGSDYGYTDLQIDTRNFFEVLPGQIFAVQAAAEFIDGSPPFRRLANFGGQNLLRGYYEGRYRDKNGIAVQAEYRIPVWWRFGLVGFAGAAQVADKVGNFGMNRFWFAGGAGLRFAWSPEERVNIRLDYGVGNNSSGLYVTVTEAF